MMKDRIKNNFFSAGKGSYCNLKNVAFLVTIDWLGLCALSGNTATGEKQLYFAGHRCLLAKKSLINHYFWEITDIDSDSLRANIQSKMATKV